VLVTALSAVGARAAWSQAERVARSEEARLTSLHEVAVGAGFVHLAHARTGPGPRDDRLFYQRSRSGGSSWSAERRLWVPGSGYRTIIPNLAVASWRDLVAIAFRVQGPAGSALLVRLSRNGGASFPTQIRIAASRRQGAFGVPALTIGRGSMVVAWTDRRTGAIRMRRGPPGGGRLRPARTLASSGLSIVCGASNPIDGLPSLTAVGRTVHLAWSAGRRGACIASSIRIRTSVDGGSSWRSARTVTNLPSYGWPELASTGRHLVLSVQRPDGSLLVASSSNRGSSFRSKRFGAPAGWVLGAGDVNLRPGGGAWITFPSVRYRGSRVVGSRLHFGSSPNDGRTWQSTVILRAAARLRQVPNLVAWRRRPVVVFQAGPVDESSGAIWSIRRR
jgi:hypothetical protein